MPFDPLQSTISFFRCFKRCAVTVRTGDPRILALNGTFTGGVGSDAVGPGYDNLSDDEQANTQQRLFFVNSSSKRTYVLVGRS